ncbi:DUF3850 domain-containing protein [Listeria rustica]|uniref:DUF3850 domain-containing protein n=1 Tax=Listeria rustica TaxID=2713503 RepID=A0A7W1YFB3_9LIST|nr:DUF3850 domain-containing protein [Listeria rustica]MBA3925530.1 DUF3850 domain-containing protein [Listeria rustica]
MKEAPVVTTNTLLSRLPANLRVHELKILKQHFEEICTERKRFETRYNDRDYKRGDVLYLREIEPRNTLFDYADNADLPNFTGREMLVIVDFVSDALQREGYVGMNFRVLWIEK